MTDELRLERPAIERRPDRPAAAALVPSVPSARPWSLGSRVGPAGREAQLVRAARSGSRDAAGALFDRYWLDAWRAAYAMTGRRALADDIAQDAFERAFASLGRFDDARPFGAWLHRIVVNRTLDVLRAERRLVSAETLSESIASDVEDVDYASREGDRSLLAAVAGLPLQRRVVIVLRFGVGLTPKAIASVLDLPVGTVNSRLARALEQLRREEQDDDG